MWAGPRWIPASTARARSRSRWRPARWSVPSRRPSGRATIVRLADVEADDSADRGDVGSVTRDVGDALGCARAAACSVITVDPGGSANLPHCHSAEDELFVVARRRRDARAAAPDGTRGVAPGRTPGTSSRGRPAPASRTPSAPATAACGCSRTAHRDPADMCFYPRSRKISLRRPRGRSPRPARGLLGRGGVSPAPRGAVRSTSCSS